MYPHIFITIHKRIYCIYNNYMTVYVYNTWLNICRHLWMHIEYVRCTERWVYHGPSDHRSPVTGEELIREDMTRQEWHVGSGCRVWFESLKDCPNFNIWGWFMGKYDSEKVDFSTENGNWPRGNPVFLASTNLRRSNLVHVVESCPLPPISGLNSFYLWVMVPLCPGEHQNSWYIDVHPTKIWYYRWWLIGGLLSLRPSSSCWIANHVLASQCAFTYSLLAIYQPWTPHLNCLHMKYLTSWQSDMAENQLAD